MRGIALCCVLALTTVCSLTITLAHHGEAAVARHLSIAISTAETDDYDAAFSLARSAGMTRTPITFWWKDLEIGPYVYDDTFPEIANLFFPAHHQPLDLGITPIAANQLVMPDDLAGKSFADMEVINRYAAMVQHLLRVMKDVETPTFFIGQEVDAWLGSDPELWQDYTTFYETVSARIRLLRPQVKIGVEGLWEGRVGPAAPFFEKLDRTSDLIAVSYYPLNDRSQVRSPETVAADFDAVTASYPGRTIHFVECGYPSSPLTGSSEAIQAEFVRAVFAAWDEHADQIELISFLMHDFADQETADFTAFYGIGGPAFAAFIGTIGLRTWPGDGAAKPGWTALVEEANARGLS